MGMIFGAMTFLVIFMPDSSVRAVDTFLFFLNPVVGSRAGNAMSMGVKERVILGADTSEVFLINNESWGAFHA